MSLLKNKFFIISVALWGIITIVRILNHIAWFDEAHAWTIAEELNLIQIFELMKIEGHTFIWYLLLMPFAKLHIGYPYVMQFLNWIFCLIALVILWKKAPFNNIIKVLITFSYPFLFLYSVYARCYSIGIMLLFMLAALYENKLKHPVLYSVLLVLCANTSLMAMIGATAFGIIFLYDFIKSHPDKTRLISTFLILTLGAILVLIQIIGVDASALANYKGIDFETNNFVGLSFMVITLGMFCILPMLLNFKKNVKPLFFILFSWVILAYIFLFQFYGHYWNHAFYYIYFMIAAWLCMNAYPSQTLSVNKEKLFLSGILILLSIINIFIPKVIKFNMVLYDIERGSDIVISKMILKDKSLIGKKIIIGSNGFLGYMLLPYHKFELLNYCGSGVFNHDYRKGAFSSEYCYDNSDESFNNVILSGKRFANLMGSDKTAYTSVDFENIFNDNQKVFLKSFDNIVSVERYNCVKVKNKPFCLYKLEKTN